MNSFVFSLLAILVSFIITAVAGKIIVPLLIKLKAGQNVRDDGPQTHMVKQGTPTMGGIIMLIGIIITSIIFSKGNKIFTVFAISCVMAFSLIGFIDDFLMLLKKRSLGLKAWQKIVLQIIVAIFLAYFAYKFLNISTLYIPIANKVADLGFWFVPFSAFVLIAMVNSVNLTDGLDGLATKLTLINALTFIVIICFFILGNSENNTDNMINTGSFCGAVAGACLAFLCFNAHPAKVFMGDTGSFALGAALSVMGISTSMQIMLPIMGLMFVLSSISVIIQVGSYKLRKKRVFRMAPLHHHFELGGIEETRVVSGYTIATALLCIGVLILCFGGI